jgi:hypothetical protein
MVKPISGNFKIFQDDRRTGHRRRVEQSARDHPVVISGLRSVPPQSTCSAGCALPVPYPIDHERRNRRASEQRHLAAAIGITPLLAVYCGITPFQANSGQPKDFKALRVRHAGQRK